LTGSYQFGTLILKKIIIFVILSFGGILVKSELIIRLSEMNPHLFHRDIERIVTTIFDEITKSLSKGNRVELRGFGAFSVKERPARIARNPRTGESVKVDDKFVTVFKTGKELRISLNKDNPIANNRSENNPLNDQS